MTRTIVTRANLTVLGVLVAIILLVGGTSWSQFNASRTARAWSEHTDEVLLTIQSLDVTVRDAETGQRGFLLTGREDYLAPYESALGELTYLQGKLQQLTADNPEEQARLMTLAPLVQHKLEELAQTVALRRNGGLDAALPIVNSDIGRDYTLQIETVLNAMSASEQALLRQREKTADQQTGIARLLMLSGTAVALLALLWAARMLNHAWSVSYKLETQQRNTALQLRASLDSLSQGVGVFAEDLTLLMWNERFHALLGLPGAVLTTGTPYVAIADTLLEGQAEFLETEAQIRHGRFRSGEPIVFERTRLDGQQLELRRSPMPGGGFVLTVTDMTKRAQAEAVLREAQKMQAIGQLTGGIAHDFNNLLTVILGNLEMIHSRLDTEPALQVRVGRATHAAQRGAALTAQLLAFARKQPLAPTPINLADTVPDLVPLLRRTLGEHIDVRYVEAAGLWRAMADPAQLESAVLNLALNARDAMPSGGRLTIEMANRVLDEDYARSHAEVTPGDYAMLAVSDTGHGMTPEILARVFEPFFTTKPDGKGTGLGLAMVFGFVKQSGGHVKIYSEPGEGTTVRLYLPRAMVATPSANQPNARPIGLPRGTATLLLVEDEAPVREVAVAMLTELGYKVLQAADGEEGLRVFGAHVQEIDLLLTDVVLPGEVRGRQLAERITAIRPEIAVLYMSGYTENSIVHHGRLDEGVQLLGKPFKREQLASKVAEVLAARARTNAMRLVTQDVPADKG